MSAQIREEKPARVVVPYRAKPEQKASIIEVRREEARDRKMSLSKVVAYLVDLGLDLYWVRNELADQMDRAASEHGWDRRKALTELIRRGLGTLEKKSKR